MFVRLVSEWVGGRERLEGDRGSVSIAAVIVAVAFLFVAVMLISQQKYLAALSEVREVSANAARAAGQKLDEDAQRTEGQAVAVKADEAEAAAVEIVNGVDGMDLKSVDIDTDRVTVVVTTTVDAALGSKTFTGESTVVAFDPNR